jgi:hypothetical protein
LYVWLRNAGNAQPAWSGDRAKTWSYAPWKFTESFGCPTFLNFGRNYAGARDGYVYVYSHDSDSAYLPADTYNPTLKRYLWCQVLPGDDPRFHGGLGVYDAPEPWGPWTTAFFADPWDVGPGETASYPTKWMSADGRTIYLVFSGEDCFSVRRALVCRSSAVRGQDEEIRTPRTGTPP